MVVNFIEQGFMITWANLDVLPDNEDRVIIFDNLYVVTDRTFRIGKKNEVNEVNVYLKQIN